MSENRNRDMGLEKLFLETYALFLLISLEHKRKSKKLTTCTQTANVRLFV